MFVHQLKVSACDSAKLPCDGCDCGLRDLKQGTCARVTDVAMNRPEAKRLVDLGFISGASVTMLRSGKTCIVRLGTTRLGLCAELQDCVRLSPSSKGLDLAPSIGSELVVAV